MRLEKMTEPLKIQIQYQNSIKKRKRYIITYTKTPISIKSILKTQEKYGYKSGRKFCPTKKVRFKQADKK